MQRLARVSLVSCLALAACLQPSQARGGARVFASSAASAIAIDHITLTVTPSAGANIVRNLFFADGAWQITLSDLPVGSYGFQADAYNAPGASQPSFTGSAANVAITANHTSAVDIVMHQTGAGISETAPQIDSVTASTPAPQQGAPVTLVASASGGTGALTYTWSATVGSFSSSGTALTATGATAIWYAPPAALGSQTLTIRVSDAAGNSAALSFILDVIPDQGSAAVNVFLPPQINSLGAAQSATNQTVWQISLVVTPPPDGDTLAYSWTTDANCASGSAFSDASARQPSFTLGGAGACILTVTITDPNPALTSGSYPSVTAHVTVSDTATVVELGPVIKLGAQSQSTAVGNDVVYFEVVAQDGNSPAQSLSYAWVASDGTPGAITNAATFSWTAPACLSSAGSAITVTVGNTFGLTASQTFTVKPASGACIVVPTPSGSFDASFGNAGFLAAGPSSWTFSNPTQMNVDSAHKLVVTGKALISGSWTYAIFKLDTATGALDPSFGTNGSVVSGPGQVNTDWFNGIDSQNRIVVGGAAPQGQTHFFLARYNADGTVDTTFGSGSGSVTSSAMAVGEILSLVVAPDRTIYAVGRTFPAGRQTPTIAHYLEDGTLDAAFGSGGVVQMLWGSDPQGNYDADAIALQPDGKLLVGGSYATNGNNNMFNVLARLNANGTLDTSFGSNGITQTSTATGDLSRKAVRIQSDGRAVVAVRGTIARFNADGTLDQAFGTGGQEPIPGLDYDYDLVIESDGKLIAGGFAGGSVFPTVVRMNPSGSADTTFGTGGVLQTQNSLGGNGFEAIALSGANLYAAATGFVIARIR